jgi:hypothetical protein
MNVTETKTYETKLKLKKCQQLKGCNGLAMQKK